MAIFFLIASFPWAMNRNRTNCTFNGDAEVLVFKSGAKIAQTERNDKIYLSIAEARSISYDPQ